jgi:hypothetical protein
VDHLRGGVLQVDALGDGVGGHQHRFGRACERAEDGAALTLVQPPVMVS